MGGFKMNNSTNKNSGKGLPILVLMIVFMVVGGVYIGKMSYDTHLQRKEALEDVGVAYIDGTVITKTNGYKIDVKRLADEIKTYDLIGVMDDDGFLELKKESNDRKQDLDAIVTDSSLDKSSDQYREDVSKALLGYMNSNNKYMDVYVDEIVNKMDEVGTYTMEDIKEGTEKHQLYELLIDNYDAVVQSDIQYLKSISDNLDESGVDLEIDVQIAMVKYVEKFSLLHFKVLSNIDDDVLKDRGFSDDDIARIRSVDLDD